MNKIIVVFSIFLFLISCQKQKDQFDATGTFEADEIIVAAEQTGKIISLNINEGQELQANTIVGQIDINGLKLQKEQIAASIDAIKQKTNSAEPQIKIYQSQIETQKAQIATLNQQAAVLNKEVNRMQNLVNAEAAPRKQLDDLTGQYAILQKQITAAQEQIEVLNAQIKAVKQNIATQNSGILSEVNPTQKRIEVIDEQISKGTIKNMMAGTILTKYANVGEFTSMGKPLYKIADLSTITLRAYITGNQLPLIKLNQKVTINTDDGKGGYKTTEGTITWISNKAEFTPKTIQTKDERANLVYAIKVAVKNDGYYKIGMYGQVKF